MGWFNPGKVAFAVTQHSLTTHDSPKHKLAHTCLNPREFAQISLGKKLAEVLKPQCACLTIESSSIFPHTFHTKIILSRSSSNLGNSEILPTWASKRLAMYTEGEVSKGGDPPQEMDTWTAAQPLHMCGTKADASKRRGKRLLLPCITQCQRVPPWDW